MKTIADLTFDDLRRIGRHAAENAVADLRVAGVLPNPTVGSSPRASQTDEITVVEATTRAWTRMGSGREASGRSPRKRRGSATAI